MTSDRTVTPVGDRSASEFPETIEVVVEIPRGSRNKYEFDERSGAIRLDRVLSAVYYPHEYGFVDDTRARGRRPHRRDHPARRGDVPGPPDARAAACC